MQETPCACGSNATLSACCLPIIQRKRKAETAAELLRARYTAFTRGASSDIDFILATHHPKTLHEVKREEIEEWAKGSQWQGLEIIQGEAGTAKDETGTIVFCARYVADGQPQEHWEQSYFEKDQGEWKFLDAKGIKQGTYRREEPKLGRNDPCKCGSGKKFKKCCG